MSSQFANLPAIAVGAYIAVLARVNAAESMHGIEPRDYMYSVCTDQGNNPGLAESLRVAVDEGSVIKANIGVGADAGIVAEFNGRAERWEKETAIYSAPGPALLHKDYIAIIAKGVANRKIIVPMILKRLQTSGADWFFALENIAGENPAKNAETFADAFNAWCGWAKAQGLIKETNEVLAA